MRLLMLETIVALAALSVLTACGTRSDGGPNKTPEVAASPAGGLPLSVADVVAPPSASFYVLFNWTEGLPRGTATFVWRQAEGTRRWDAIAKRGDHTDGDFVVESLGLTRSSGASSTPSSCLWNHQGRAADATVICERGVKGGALSQNLESVIRAALGATSITSRVADEVIAGHSATCYQFADPLSGDGRICVGRDGIPLYLRGHYGNGGQVQEIQAVRVVSDAAVDPSVPPGLPFSTSIADAAPYPVINLRLPISF